MAQNKYVSPSKLSVFLENLKGIFSPLTHVHKLTDISDYQVDTALSSTSNNPLANSAIDAEFEAVSEALNIYNIALESVIENKVETSDIVDNLTTSSTDKPLSANQGAILQDQITEMKGKLSDLLYEAITIPSFTVSSLVSSGTGGTYTKSHVELGTTVTSVTLTWSTSKDPVALTLEGASIDATKKSHTYTGLNLKASKTYTLKAKDERGAEPSKTTTLTFCNGIYYGVGSTAGSFTSAFVTGLTKKLQTAKAYDFTVSPSDQYIYYALPVRLGTVSFKVGGFEGGFEAPETVSVTNASGYTENYYVYRSTNKITGSTAVDVT